MDIFLVVWVWYIILRTDRLREDCLVSVLDVACHSLQMSDVSAQAEASVPELEALTDDRDIDELEYTGVRLSFSTVQPHDLSTTMCLPKLKNFTSIVCLPGYTVAREKQRGAKQFLTLLEEFGHSKSVCKAIKLWSEKDETPVSPFLPCL